MISYCYSYSISIMTEQRLFLATPSAAKIEAYVNKFVGGEIYRPDLEPNFRRCSLSASMAGVEREHRTDRAGTATVFSLAEERQA